MVVRRYCSVYWQNECTLVSRTYCRRQQRWIGACADLRLTVLDSHFTA